MKLPCWPTIGPISSITPSLYNELIRCPARALWAATGARNVLPENPRTLLGQAFHYAISKSSRLDEQGANQDVRQSVSDSYQACSLKLYEAAHPLIRWRWPTVRHLPDYEILKEYAVRCSLKIAPRGQTSRQITSHLIEYKLASRDGLVRGRPDHIDTKAGEVVDYKSGRRLKDDENFSEDELRQLYLYAYLCHENSIEIRTGVIIRRNGQRDEVSIDHRQAMAEADRARLLLGKFNDSIASVMSMNSVAVPSVDNCQYCPCRVMCEPYWQECHKFAPSTTVSIQGTVLQLERREFRTSSTYNLKVLVDRGSIPSGLYDVPSIPTEISDIDGAKPLKVGDRISSTDMLHDNSNGCLRTRRYGLTTLWKDD